METNTNTAHSDLIWEDADGSIEHVIIHARGQRPYGFYVVYDRIGLVFGSAANAMRDCMKPGAKHFEVEFPNGTRKGYATLANARKAIERAEASGSYQ